MKYNVWNKWGKLKAVMLGQCYHPDFFRDIKQTKIKDALMKIAEETQEDLENYAKILKDFGCDVIRPNLDINDSIMNHINFDGKIKGKQGVPRSPLQPRDGQLVIGNEMFYTLYGEHPSIKNTLDSYKKSDRSLIIDDPIKHHPLLDRNTFDNIKGVDWLSYDDYLKENYFDIVPTFVRDELRGLKYIYDICAASMTVIGRDLYVDASQHGNITQKDPRIIEVVKKHLEQELGQDQYRINMLSHGGHSDGCFHALKPGALLSLHKIQKYNDTFPGWDVCYLPDQSWDLISDFLLLKEKVAGKWWVPGEEGNDELTYFVETWLQDWVGYVEETVFDVNVLMLDERHVCVTNYNETSFKFFKKHNIEPIIVPWRHRFFWDGGLHCITLDLIREGTQEDYFPDRFGPINDRGFD